MPESEELEQLKALIRQVADDLLCETHPSVCNMRDKTYNELEMLVIDLSQKYDAETVQEAFALIESNY